MRTLHKQDYYSWKGLGSETVELEEAFWYTKYKLEYKQERQTFPILPPLPCAMTKVNTLLDRRVKDVVVQFSFVV